MCGNTRPKLVEVSYGQTSQQNKRSFLCELTALDGVPHKLKTRTPRWFPDPRCRTSDRQPTPSGPTTWHYDGDRRRTEKDEDGDGRRRRQTKTETGEDGDGRRRRRAKTETDEDGDRRRRRQTKTETVEDEDRLTLRTSGVAAPLQLTTPQCDEDGTWYFTSYATRWVPSPWRMQQSLQPQVQSLNRPSPLVPELAFGKTFVKKRWQSPQVVPTGLTERLTTKTFRHYGLNWTTSSSFLTVLCIVSTYFPLFRTSSTYLNGRSYQTNN